MNNCFISFEEAELEKVRMCCKKYGYQAFLRFDAIHIHTLYESWYFVPNENGCIKLMHGNLPGHFCDKFHKQFTRYHMNYESLIQYIHEHEYAKYTGRNVCFTFTKRGVPKQAFC